jgi:hypothetical protein
MCPVIRISDDTFAMLQKVAQPLVDTPDSAIRRALAVYLSREETKSEVAAAPTKPQVEQHPHVLKQFDPDSPPDVTHTSFLNGEVAGAKVDNWNHLLLKAHAAAYQAIHGDLAALKLVSEANIRKGVATASGFKPVKQLGFSVQGVEAKKAWSISLGLAKKFGFNISAQFRWREKEGAAYPGQLGRLSWVSTSKK